MEIENAHVKIPMSDCQCSVTHYATQQYNRVTNRAVIGGISKRFLLSGRAELQELELQINELKRSFEQVG